MWGELQEVTKIKGQLTRLSSQCSCVTDLNSATYERSESLEKLGAEHPGVLVY